ncbi:MAG: glycosyltransferase family 39 protein [Phycisphaerae bacterium]|nr:glycosyltransferase family 39 protein [Phycisphaerae bacterium]
MPPPPRAAQSRFRRVASWWPLIAIFVAALGLRLVYLAQTAHGPLFDSFHTDARWHSAWAKHIAEGRWNTDRPFFRAPLYPLFLAGAYRITGDSFLGARVLQHVLGALSCALVGLLGARAFNARVGWVAGVICAVYAPLIYFENELLIPSLAITLFLTMLLFLEAADRRSTWWNWLAAGLLLGMCAITRPTFLALGPVVVLWWLARRLPGRGWRLRVRDTAIFTAGAVLPILPVTLHNRINGGEWVLISTQGGANFFIGNNPEADGKTAFAFAPLRWEEHAEYVDNVWWASRVNAETLTGRQMSEQAISRFWYEKGLDFWREQPSAALKLTLHKAYYLLNAFEIESNRSMYLDRLWSAVATVLLSSEQCPIAYPFGVVGPLALVGLCWRGRGRSVVALLRWVVLCYAVVIVAFFVTGRFRAPLVPVLAIFAADAALRLMGAVRAREFATARIVSFALIGMFVLCNSALFGVRDIDFTRQAGIIGAAYREDGQLRLAQAYLAKAAEEAEPENFAAHLDLGWVELQLGDNAAAESCFRRVLDVVPQMTDARSGLGAALLEQGRTAEAREQLEQALMEIPEHATTLLLVARLEYQAGHAERAEQLLDRARMSGAQVPPGWLAPAESSPAPETQTGVP